MGPWPWLRRCLAHGWRLRYVVRKQRVRNAARRLKTHLREVRAQRVTPGFAVKSVFVGDESRADGHSCLRGVLGRAAPGLSIAVARARGVSETAPRGPRARAPKT